MEIKCKQCSYYAEVPVGEDIIRYTCTHEHNRKDAPAAINFVGCTSAEEVRRDQ